MTCERLIGRFGPEFEVPIERGAIRAFAKSIHAPWPAYLEDRRATIPPSFLATANVAWGYTLERPRGTLLVGLDHDLAVPLHAEESYLFHGEPPRAGDLLIARAGLESVVTKQGRRGGDLTFLTLLTEFREPGGRLAAEARSVTVTTTASKEDGEPAAEAPAYRPCYTTLEAPDTFSGLTRQPFAELTLGMGPGIVDGGMLTLHDMVRYQAAGGEDNPLHYDLAHAQAFGFPGFFGVGMHQAGMLGAYAARWLGPRSVRSFRARFRAVYFVGDELTYEGRVAGLRKIEGGQLADLSLVCRRKSDGADIVTVEMSMAEG
ncbi:MAG: MaoC family dehydratase N-terminal domain-containing protein [Hyphomicrobiaceae bacterium]